MHANGRPTLEVHLFNFDQSIYRRHLRVEFLHKLRDEAKFPSVEALIAQIDEDARRAREMLNV